MEQTDLDKLKEELARELFDAMKGDVSGNQRDFLVDRIHPSRSLGHIVFVLGEIEITP